MISALGIRTSQSVVWLGDQPTFDNPRKASAGASLVLLNHLGQSVVRPNGLTKSFLHKSFTGCKATEWLRYPPASDYSPCTFFQGSNFVMAQAYVRATQKNWTWGFVFFAVAVRVASIGHYPH